MVLGDCSSLIPLNILIKTYAEASLYLKKKLKKIFKISNPPQYSINLKLKKKFGKLWFVFGIIHLYEIIMNRTKFTFDFMIQQ